MMPRRRLPARQQILGSSIARELLRFGAIDEADGQSVTLPHSALFHQRGRHIMQNTGEIVRYSMLILLK